MNRKEEMEDLFIRSLDQPLSEEEKARLDAWMKSQPDEAGDWEHFRKLRQDMVRDQPATFGPYFAQKVIHHIERLRVEVDQQIIFFFRRYQLAALGVFMALLALNVVFSDQKDISSVLGIQEAASGDEDEIESFDFSQLLMNYGNDR